MASSFQPVALNDIPAAVRSTLEEYIASRWDELDSIGKPVTEAATYLRDFVLNGGKRIRPLYGWAGFVGAGGLDGDEDPQAVLKAVSALEFIQACALIHDDIIDSSATRRGNPTVHKAVAATHKDQGHIGDPSHYGTSVAILVGDLALSWADDMIYDSGLSVEALQRVRAPWKAMRTEVIGGQLLDISLEASGSEDPQLARSVNRYKTAAYTIERPLHIGAAIANAKASTVEAFRGYGTDIGIAFQLRDDLLGVFGDPAITGKPAGDDLVEGKRTELLALALSLCDASDPTSARRLRQGVGTDPDTAELASIIENSGAVTQMEEQISALTASGLAHITEAGLPAEVEDLLRTLAIRATERRS